MNGKNKDRFLHFLELDMKSYRNSLDKLEEEPNRIGAHGAHSPFFPIYYRKNITWILEGLLEMGHDITQFEERIAEMDEELEAYINSHKEEFLNSLHEDLIKLIAKYKKYFTYFQEYKEYFRTSEKVSPLDKAYFLNREDGLLFHDGYEFDILISTRTYIEVLFEYLEGIYDLSQLKAKVQDMDIIFKRDLDDILKVLEIEKYYSYAPFSPDRYWWMHIDERD